MSEHKSPGTTASVNLPIGITRVQSKVVWKEMQHKQLMEALATCETAARAGGQQLLDWRGRFQTREKGACDLVTDADLASQNAIRAVLAERFPDHAFVGEERTDQEFVNRLDQFVWIADPLDGTTNYVHGYPLYAVSLALTQGQQVLVGVIYDPLRDECYSAAQGGGAWCNGRRLKTSKTKRLRDALVGVSLPPRVQGDSADLLDFVELAQVCQALRRSGSAALNMAHVANGTLDAFWATFIHPWDVAAGVLLIREAGGIVTARDGGEFDLWNPHLIVAAQPALHREMLAAMLPFKRR